MSEQQEQEVSNIISVFDTINTLESIDINNSHNEMYSSKSFLEKNKNKQEILTHFE